jgi:hypothetical protein
MMMKKSRIEATFAETIPDFYADNAGKVYVMDYSNQTDKKRGVEWTNSKPDDIEAFVIHNTPLIKISFVVFKDNTKLTGTAIDIPHCEGILYPTTTSDKTWITFLELKYPKKKNLGEELQKAQKQLLQTLDIFRSQGIIDIKRLVYLIFSAPKYSKKTPFESWCMKPDELKEIRKTKFAIMRGINDIEVISAEKLKV